MNNDNPKRIYRSRREKMIAGVCGGTAEFFNLDPTIIRLIWVVFVLFGGWGILMYIIAWFIIPKNPNHIIAENIPPQQPPPTSGSSMAMGIVMISFGSIFLLKHIFGLVWGIFAGGKILLALLMIGFGVFLFKKKKTLQQI